MTVRSLPLRLEPVPGEALDSYLEAAAYRSQVAWADLLNAIGVSQSETGCGSSGYGWLVRLTDEQAVAMSYATGVNVPDLHAMTLSALTSDMSPAPSDMAVSMALASARSRFCPRCLHESDGRWQLWWRLRWAFACLEHHCLLADSCPECERWQRGHRLPNDVVPTPGRCARTAAGSQGRSPARCAAALSAAQVIRLADDSVVIAAQRRILRYLQGELVGNGLYRAYPVSVPQFFADAAAVSGRVLAYAPPEELHSRAPSELLDAYWHLLGSDHRRGRNFLSPRASAASAAVGAVTAVEILTSADGASAGQRLHWLVRCSRAYGSAVTATNIGWGKHISDPLRAAQLSALEAQLSPSDQLRYRSGALLPRRPRAVSGRHHHVPAILWPRAARRFKVPGVGPEQLGSGLAAAVLLVGSRSTLAHAAGLLGSATTASSVSRVLQALHADTQWSAIRAAVIRAADALDAGGCPIDYHHRRALPFAEFLPESQWRDICYDTATAVGGAVKIRLMRCWMYERLTGSPAGQCTHAGHQRGFRAKLAGLVRSMTPDLLVRLDLTAQLFLDMHGCAGEPLWWQPPEALLADLVLPQPVRPRIDVAELHHLIQDPGLTLTAVAARLGITLDDVRDTLAAQPAPRVLDEQQMRCHGAAFARVRARLSRAQFIELYVDEGLGLAEIAHRTGTSRNTVRRLADYYDIPVRPGGAPPPRHHARDRPRGHRAHVQRAGARFSESSDPAG